jgi:3-oxoacyl-(acyl-carrier-protein) synthase
LVNHNKITAAISGIGCVSAVGNSYPETLTNLFHTPPEPHLPRRFSTTLELPVFELDDKPAAADDTNGVTLTLLRLALDEALASAQLSRAELSRRRVGVCLGTTIACQLNNLPFYAALRRGEPVSGKPITNFMDGSLAEWVRREYRLNGPALTVSNACTSSADAVGIGMLWIQQDICDVVIAGGADELNKVPLDGFNALGVCSAQRCRPFDAERDGLNLGEGAGIVILENLHSARVHNNAPKFILPGFGKALDAYHITQPHPEGLGLKQAIKMALKMAKLSTDDIGFVNAHGTGTTANDQIEANALIEVFGKTLKYMSTKALTGHTLGAAGVLELIFCCAMLEQCRVVKSCGFSTLPNNILAPPLTANQLISSKIALSTSLAFGGSNTALLVKILE